MDMKKQQTAMMQLLNQLRDERQNLPMNIEWDRCYQAIEMVIENTYLKIEKEQIIDAYEDGRIAVIAVTKIPSEQYYNETYEN
jgi:hypothetical protein